ncbi:hypothetical protein [Nocardiopsis sp. NRRL B-16309]|uniref:hypothetical protein n=1 Tax=Nocardiopsis sp. NRRL B-16309 TaxID=1519494 RepID=UPI0006AF0EBF|nr:hypothetical protein [Nocardiopsis sp. NRRL B-16309]KOX17031.1 hypothetical protein ADL05_10675 [Nocardiopsis sp. NRRL B-16309]
MIDRIGSLGDRLLARVAPRVRARAAGSWACWTERTNHDGRAVCRRCCIDTSAPGAPICGYWSVNNC